MSHLIIHAQEKKSIIHKEIYGHFSEHLGRCIYGGLFVGEDSPIPNVHGMRTDVVKALRQIHIPVLRWPGGCFADEYHWKDGVGPKESRKRMVNTNWGGEVEDNSFGTHEFMELCRQLNCQPYITGNVGSGTVQEMSEWVEYMTFDGISPMAQWRRQNGRDEPWKLKYFGVGNENWCCGGNMRPEYYADLYRRYQTFVRNYGGNKIFKIACGPNIDDYNWTETVMKLAGDFMDAFSLHYYVFPDGWTHRGSALDFDDDFYYLTLQKALWMDELITRHTNIMERYDPAHRVGLVVDEWGAWYDVEPGTNPGFLYQQNTMRDALVAAITLNIFNQHCDRVIMANLAQTVNVLQAVLLTEGDKLVRTPTYHVFELFKAHQDATLLHSHLECDTIGGKRPVPALHESASIDREGVIHITLANLSVTDRQTVTCEIGGVNHPNVTGRILTNAKDAYNDFDHPDAVVIQEFQDYLVESSGLTLRIPPCSVVELAVN